MIPELLHLNCVHCQRPFSSFSDAAKYCGLRCKQAAAHKRRAQRDRTAREKLTEADLQFGAGGVNDPQRN